MDFGVLTSRVTLIIYAMDVKAKQINKWKTNICKARLVLRGCEKRLGLVYKVTFAPNVRWGIFWGLVVLVAKCKYPIYDLDVKTTFLHGHIRKQVMFHSVSLWEAINIFYANCSQPCTISFIHHAQGMSGLTHS